MSLWTDRNPSVFFVICVCVCLWFFVLYAVHSVITTVYVSLCQLCYGLDICWPYDLWTGYFAVCSKCDGKLG